MIKDLSKVSMQFNGNSSTSKLPTPENISKWSIARKRLLSENNSLKREINSKDSIISDLKNEVKNLEIKDSIRGSLIPDGFGVCSDVYFDVNLISESNNCITYSVSNSSMDFETEVDVYYSDIIDYLDSSNFSQLEFENCVHRIISDSLSF